MTALSQEEAFARIRLLRSPHIGPVTYRQLLRRCGSAEAALRELPQLTQRASKPYQLASEAVIAEEIRALRRCGGRYLFHDGADYPRLLAQLDSAPPILTVQGDTALAARQCVAIVGARNCSAAAVKLARKFAGDLAEAGFVIVSGLARGIDGAAHRAALEHGTIGVIASGIDIAYPPEHADLQQAIGERGLLVAEQPPGTEPLARHFPSRNRIIAGLAAGTLVVEAAPRSGSLITARLAGEAGREVMAVPGSPLDARAQGCNQLIRDGAILVQTADDVIELLRPFAGEGVRPADTLPLFAENESTASDHAPVDVAALLTVAPIGVDELVRQSGASVAAVQMALIELELTGGLIRHAGGKVSRVD